MAAGMPKAVRFCRPNNTTRCREGAVRVLMWRGSVVVADDAWVEAAKREEVW